jgi:hypothetical protein
MFSYVWPNLFRRSAVTVEINLRLKYPLRLQHQSRCSEWLYVADTYIRLINSYEYQRPMRYLERWSLVQRWSSSSLLISLNLRLAWLLIIHFYIIEGKRPLGRPRRRWVDNIKMDLREIGWDGVDWFDMAQDRDQWTALVNMVLNLRVP